MQTQYCYLDEFQVVYQTRLQQALQAAFTTVQPNSQKRFAMNGSLYTEYFAYVVNNLTVNFVENWGALSANYQSTYLDGNSLLSAALAGDTVLLANPSLRGSWLANGSFGFSQNSQYLRSAFSYQPYSSVSLSYVNQTIGYLKFTWSGLHSGFQFTQLAYLYPNG